MGDELPFSLIASALLVLGVLFLPAGVAAFYAAQDLFGWVRHRRPHDARGFEPVVRDRPADEP